MPRLGKTVIAFFLICFFVLGALAIFSQARANQSSDNYTFSQAATNQSITLAGTVNSSSIGWFYPFVVVSAILVLLVAFLVMRRFSKSR